MKVITHNDRFHADDVFTMATLRILFGEQITEVVRTRDEAIIQTGDIVFDVGNIYDPEKNRFDHHQTEGAGVRENGVPYASFGVVWKKWGEEICGSAEAARIVDEKIVLPIDACDNWFVLYDYRIEGVREYVMDTICGSFGSTWKEEENFDTAFFEMVDIAEKILRREIKVAQDRAEAIPLVEEAYAAAEDKRIVVLDIGLPWKSVLEKYPEVLFVVSPSIDRTQWRIGAMQSVGFVNRKSLPKEWAGLRGEELVRVSGVPGALFCHRTLFMAAAQTKEAAIELAKKAVQS